jgi:hypothetical protein
MKNHLRLINFLVFFTGILNAQNTPTIIGTIKNSESQNLDAILVTLLLSKDNSLVKTTFSEPDGQFEFDNLPDNTYTIAIDDPAYKSYISEAITIAKSNFRLPEIKLFPLEKNELSEVVIQKKKPFVEQKIDRTVVNVDAMISNAGSDAMDVLEKSPGIMIDQNGTITFKGKTGVSVFIDDKPTYLSGADLEAYLKSLPASTLNQIEFMTNPPAKYDAAGSAGVINIKTKKSKIRGFNGSISSRVSQGKKGMNRNSLNLNYTNGKIRLYGNAGFATQESVTDLYIFRRYKNEDQSTKTLFYQNTLMTGSSNTTNAKIGLDYYVSDKTTLGISLTGLSRSGNNKSEGSSELTNAASALDSTIVADNNEEKTFKNGGITLNYSREFDGGKMLTADADFLNYSDETSQRYRNYIYQPDNTLSSSDESVGKLPSKISIYTFKTDYVHPMKKDASFDTGYKVSYSETDNVADYSDIINGNPVPNYDTSNHFRYNEIIHAVYFNFNKSYKRFSFQAGLRLESTISKGNQLGNIVKPASQFERDYTNLFPTAYAMYKLDSIGDNSLVVSYGKRINRPYYQDLNPFLSPLDKFTFYSGNPYLNPSFGQNVELSYRFKSIFSTALSYSKSKDDINETIEINDGIYYSRPGNIGKSEYMTLNAQSDFDVTKWFATGIYADVTHADYKSDLYTEGLDSSGTFFSFSANTRFTIDKSWSAEMTGRYSSTITSSQFTLGSRSTIDIAIQKKIFHDKGTLKFAVNDIFYTSINNGIINNLKNTDATWKNKPDSRFAALTFVYSFGKTFQSKSQERSGAETEQNRVKD